MKVEHPATEGKHDALDDVARRTRRLDLAAGVLGGGSIAMLEMGGALAKRGFHASDGEIACLTSGQSLGLIFSFLIAHFAASGRKVRLVWVLETFRGLALGMVFFVRATQSLGFVACHATAQMCQAMSIPARVTVYRFNYPSRLRGSIVGRNRQIQLLVATLVAVLLSAALEWSLGFEALTRVLGPSPLSAHGMLRVLVPAFAALGLVGTFVFSRIQVAESYLALPERRPTLRSTLRSFVRVWREDRDFRRYELFFMVFGFANIMSLPLTQIHAVDELDANYFDLALINVVLVQGVMCATLGFWGKLVDRYPPAQLRGVLNLIFAVDFLFLAFAPTVGWVYVGRVFRGFALGGGSLVWMLGSLYYAGSPRRAPIYVGIHAVLTGLRWLVAPFVGVWVKALCGGDARPVFLFSFVVVVATGVGMIREGRREKPRRGSDEPPIPAPRTPGG